MDECLEDVVRVETILDGIAGTNSAEMIRLERRVAAGDFAAVVREGDALLASGKLGPAETTLAALRADTARVATELSAGRAVPLRFSAGGVFVNGSRTGAGWRASEGWVAERWGGEMSTMSAETTLYGTVPLPRNVELRGTYSWNDPDSQFGRKSQLVRIELEEDEDPEHLPYLARVSMRPWESGGLKLSLDGADYHPGHDQIQPG